MANVIFKSNERKQHEAFVRDSFGVREGDREAAECAEIIAAQSREAVEYGKEIGGKKTWSF